MELSRRPCAAVAATALACTILIAGPALAQGAPDAATQAFMAQVADAQRRPEAGVLLAAAVAGNRIVAAGANGVIVLSDDQGKTFRQANVPLRVQITGLFFTDDRTGWAVGHGGVILRSDDAGVNWILQRKSLDTDQPLFSVYFANKDEGWAVGLWSLMLHTADGGRTWNRVELPAPGGQGKADLNLFKVFGNGAGAVYVACERGQVLRSLDGGQHWEFSATGYQGSLWTGVAWPDGTVVAAGLRGSVVRSSDGGKTWTPVLLGQDSSITGLVRDGQAAYGVGFDGLLISSNDQGRTFSVSRREDRTPLTAIVRLPAGPYFVVSKMGVPAQALWKGTATP
jgi:photosystem II stability/assembly factor-like uncharacterized protein